MVENGAAIVEIALSQHLWRISPCDVTWRGHGVTEDCASPLKVYPDQGITYL